ncbi:MAG: type II secretion system F family protein [Pseudomonadota bacterium]
MGFVIDGVVLVSVVLAVLLAGQGIYHFVLYLGQRQRAELRRRLEAVDKPGRQSGILSLYRERRIARSETMDRLLRPLPAAQRLEKLLLQTDLPWTVATVIGLSVLCATVLTLGLYMTLRANPGLALFGIPLGLAIPPLSVVSARIRRSKKISIQLPDALDMMVRSLRAGHGISAGFKLVAKEAPAPIAIEFAHCFEEQQFGVDFRDAVEHMTERVPNNLDLKIFAVSLLIQRDTGGNLVEILEQISQTIRDRFRFYGKLDALTAEGRWSGYILGALPFVCVLAVALFNPGYLVPLMADPIGRLIALGGLGLWIVGVFWMKRMIKVDF